MAQQGIRGIRQTIPSGYMIGRQSPGSSKGAPGLIPLPPLNQQPIIAGAGGKATQGSNSSVGFTVPNATGQIPGTTTNDDATAGNIGEFVSIFVSGVSVSNNTAGAVTSISLTAGDWDVEGIVMFFGAPSTIVTQLTMGVSTISGAFATQGKFGRMDFSGPSLTGLNMSLNSGPLRFSLATTTTVYLNYFALFTTSMMTAAGQLRARRVR